MSVENEQDTSIIANELPSQALPIVLDPILNDETLSVKIKDREFVPENSIELAKAMEDIAKVISPLQIKDFYKKIRNIALKFYEESKTDLTAHDVSLGDVPDEEEPEMTENKKYTKEHVKQLIAKILRESPGPDDDEEDLDTPMVDDEYELPDDWSSLGLDSEEEDDDLEAPPPLPQAEEEGEMSLEDMAAEFGYSSAAGIRQEMERIIKRWRYMIKHVEPNDLDQLTDFALTEYIDGMYTSGYLDESDKEEFLKNPELVKDLDSFRFFISDSVIMPAYRKMLNNLRNDLKKDVKKIDKLPKNFEGSVMNFVTGDSKLTFDKLLIKLDKELKKSKMSDSEREDIKKSVRAAIPKIAAKTVDYTEDLVKNAISLWKKQNPAKKAQGIERARIATIEYNEELNKKDNKKPQE